MRHRSSRVPIKIDWRIKMRLATVPVADVDLIVLIRWVSTIILFGRFRSFANCPRFLDPQFGSLGL